jgi:hypothetical protein
MSFTLIPQPTDAQMATIAKYEGRINGIHMYANGYMTLTIDRKSYMFKKDGTLRETDHPPS